MKVYNLFQTESGEYRLVLSDEHQVVENIFEGTLRFVLNELLKLENAGLRLVLKKGKVEC